MQKVKHALLALMVIYMRFHRGILARNKNSVLFFTPDIPISNLGDQALFIGALEGLLTLSKEKIYAIANGPEKLSEVPFRPKAHENIVLVEDLYLAFATDKAFSELIKLLWLSRKANSLILVGADVIDGRYHAEEAARKIKIVRMLSRTGVHCRIVGFSISENVSPLSAKQFKLLDGQVKAIARDDVSRVRMQKYANCQLGADCAFLMQAHTESKEFEKLVEWKGQQTFTVGLCLREEDFMGEKGQRELPVFIKSLLAAMPDSPTGIVLLPHHPGDIHMLSSASDELKRQGYINIFAFSELPAAAQVKGYVSLCDHVITSRMHVAIASLGMNTAITCLPYAGKFEGLFKHFEFSDAGIDRDKVHDDDYLSAYLSKRFGKTDELQSQIRLRLPQIRKLSQSNFDGL